jgi:nitrite reductase/ring-hydroxylating ferredoxin subunit
MQPGHRQEGVERSGAFPRVRAGSLADLRAQGQLLTKVGPTPVVVFWHQERPWAIDDRCPHMGFPLHRGTLEDGLVTCHWHHARFDLASGSTLDPFADDARAYDVEVSDGDVYVIPRPEPDPEQRLTRRLREGLEDGFTLVMAKSVLGLLEAGVPSAEVVRVGTEFGTAYRGPGWGSGLTVLVAMANLLPHLRPEDRGLALVHGLSFVSRDTRDQPPRFPLTPMGSEEVPLERLAEWYRGFLETRSEEAAERTLVTALDREGSLPAVERMMSAAVTDHVFIDEGHTLDFTNKAFELLEHLGPEVAPAVLPTLIRQTAQARRDEELAAWRHPHDLVGLIRRTEERLPSLLEKGEERRGEFQGVGELGWRILAEDPEEVVEAICEAAVDGATPEQLGRGVAYAAALRIVRFHTQNDFGDWNTVHHAFTYANALHAALARNPTPDLLRGVIHGALRVFLDRFLNVPPARLPQDENGDLATLAACWHAQEGVNEAGALAYGYLRGGGDPAELVAALAGALLQEDAGFHWYQIVEAGIRQHHAWPSGSEEGALILAGVARFLAAHTPTRRELPQVVRIAARLRRGEALHEELGASD